MDWVLGKRKGCEDAMVKDCEEDEDDGGSDCGGVL